MKIAVITGASSGMGKQFVLALDKSFSYDEIWVIARREERLKALQSDVKARIRAVPMDLTDEAAAERLASVLKETQPEIKTLVNASGYGKFDEFANLPLEVYDDMIDLNVKAYVAVTYVCLPYMKKGSEIYQLASYSAFIPVPYINIYAATKAFVLSFSRALNVELKDRGIKVIAVCPYWVKTEFFDRAVTENKVVNRIDRYHEPEKVVARALRDMKRGKDVSVVGASDRFRAFFMKVLPHRFAMKIWVKQQKKNTDK
ncbi:MAG: SDR family NAD(P)-dependent oxidoreductase [Clostridia bacterium]|nr:SDR family NAD(P)-dependent oxidoreductase [Clostridia bacterium]